MRNLRGDAFENTRMRTTPMHRNAATYLKLAARELRGEPTGWKGLVAAAAGRLGLGKWFKKGAALGAEAGATSRRNTILPGPDLLMRSTGEAKPQPALSADATRRLAELFVGGTRGLNIPEAHAALKPLGNALRHSPHVRHSSPDLRAAVEKLVQSDLSLTDYRLALALLDLAAEGDAGRQLMVKATDDAHSDLYPVHYATAAGFYLPQSSGGVDGDVMMQVLADRDGRARS